MTFFRFGGISLRAVNKESPVRIISGPRYDAQNVDKRYLVRC